MTIQEYNNLSKEAARDALTKCCGSSTWVEGMLQQPSPTSLAQLLEQADTVWDTCTAKDGLEAFTHHPKIGDVKSLEKKFASTKEWAGNEQSGVQSASHKVIEDLAAGNTAYEERFGYIFIVCATGKSASEMLELLQARLDNPKDKELQIAMGEQHKITKIRINKLIQHTTMSQITTHVLDTSIGKPGQGIAITLSQQNEEGNWQILASGVTNEDGRISNLLPSDKVLDPGIYMMFFETGAYFKRMGTDGFYPFAQIAFEVKDDAHYHVPLLLNPFGYSTYRGS